MNITDRDDRGDAGRAATGRAASLGSGGGGRAARRKYWVDLGLFAAWLVASLPGLTGVPLHEAVSMGIIVVLLSHVVMHWSWVVRHLTRWRVRAQNQVNRLLDLAMWGLAITVMLSGIVISEWLLPALGIPVQQTSLWIQMHSASSALLLLVLASHLLSHAGWIVSQTKAVLAGARR